MDKPKRIRLYDAQKGDRFLITFLEMEGVMRRRLLDLGFFPGAMVEVMLKSPLGDPVAYRVSRTSVALRKEETQRIYGELVKNE